MKLLIFLLVFLIALPAFAQVAIEPGFAYRLFSAKAEDAEIQAQMAAEIPLSYLIPLSDDGEHNVKVLGGPGIGTGYQLATFGVGYAYAPLVQNKMIVSGTLVFDITFPEEDFANGLVETGKEAWLNIGAQFGFDFETQGLAAQLSIGASHGLREAPDQVVLILRLPTQPSGANERVQRAE